MWKQYKWKIILSSLVVLLPVLAGLFLWNILPQTIITHWGADGTADGVSSKAFAIFVPSFILLLGHVVCILSVTLGKSNREQTAKAVDLVFWIMPVVSLVTGGVLYSSAFGWTGSIGKLMPLAMGILFVVMGNYLPKVKQNKTLGIKLPWTLSGEENWNRTHRFGGKVWVAGGLALIIAMFLPETFMIGFLLIDILAMVAIPTVYSYVLHRRGIGTGEKPPVSKFGKIMTVVGVVLLLGCLALLVTGDIQYTCEEGALQIHATYWEDITVDLSKVETVTLEQQEAGIRTWGFGTPRLSLGIFHQEALGSYTRYAYTGQTTCVILRSGDHILVLTAKTPEQTTALYEEILSRMP